MCWLAGVVCKDLNEVFKRSVLCLGSVLEYVQLLRGRIYISETTAGGGECCDVGDGVAGIENLHQQFGGEILEKHGRQIWRC